MYDFGEPGNDWLDLGGKRVNVPTKRIGNNQILGEVHLSLRDSRSLVEKTNREGFVETRPFNYFDRRSNMPLAKPRPSGTLIKPEFGLRRRQTLTGIANPS